MKAYEYKVVPAPTRGLKARGVKTNQDRFANALETVMNDLASEGWEYQRADTLPCEEREGLMGKTTVFQNMLVFRRAVNKEAPVVAAPMVATAPARVAETLAAPAPAEKTAPVPVAIPRPDTTVAAE